MKNLFKIALGNLWEHKAKTLILGLFVCFGVAIIILGMGFLESANNNMEKDYRAHYTGDIVIHGPSPKKGVLTLFGVQENVSLGEMPKTPALPDAQALLDELKNFKGIASRTKVISGMIIVSPKDLEEDFQAQGITNASFPYGFFLSGDNEYFKTFPDVKIIEGQMYSSQYPSLIMDKSLKHKFENYYKKVLAVGDSVLLEGFDIGGGASLREVTVTGFFEHPDPNTTMMSLCYIDENTARALQNLTFGSVFARDLPETIDFSLSSVSENDLFSTDDMFDSFSSSVTKANLTENEVDSILGDTSIRDKMNELADGAWQFVVLKLDRPQDVQSLIEKLNMHFKEIGMNVKAINWKTAASGFAMGTAILGTIFTILIVLLAVVVFIVIMNTLIASIMERTSEIGTMRALGAKRSFVRKLIFVETSSIVLLASLAGIALAMLATLVVNASHIKITNDTAKLFLGGAAFTISPTLSSILITIVAIFVGASLANLYPVSFAIKISPLKAMNQES